MRDWCDALIVLLLGPLCAACAEPLDRPTRGCICDACWRAIIRTASPCCDRCGGPLDLQSPLPNAGATCSHCAQTPSSIDAVRAIGPHEGSLRHIVHALKYDARRSIAPRLAALMREAAADLLHGADAVVPVPLHQRRRRSRGFNQAADIARHLGRPVVHALVRTRHTPTQTALPAADRRANVADAFRVTRHAPALRGAAVVLVDDVRTTGATLEACASALRRAGVSRVAAVTAARVETRDW
jgi:ComF family protein